MTEIDVFHPVVGASPPPPGPPGAVEGLQAAGGLDMAPPPGDLAAASALMDASMAAHTIRAYARDWRAWTAYAGAHGLQPLPAEPAHVCAFLAAYSTGRKATTPASRASTVTSATPTPSATPRPSSSACKRAGALPNAARPSS